MYVCSSLVRFHAPTHISTKLVELLFLVETVIAQVLFVFTIGTDLPALPPDNIHRTAKLICGDILRAQLWDADCRKKANSHSNVMTTCVDDS